MDTYKEDQAILFKDVFAHLSQVKEEPATARLDADLLKRAERSLDPYNTPRQLLWRVLQTGEELLQILEQNPAPLTRLLEQTVDLIPFDELKASISTSKLEEGLQSPSVPIQLLCIAYLTKAADQPSGAAFVAASSSLVQILVTTWLSVENTEVSERALECLVALLGVDSPSCTTIVLSDINPSSPSSPSSSTTSAAAAAATTTSNPGAYGQGLLWRRIFHDPDVYSLFFLWTSLIKSNYDLKTKKGKQAATISQARLFDFVARVADLDWIEISTTALPNVEAPFVIRKQDTTTEPTTESDSEADAAHNDGHREHEQPYGGILKYVASHMIDPSDYLMEVLRRNFFTNLLNLITEEEMGEIEAAAGAAGAGAGAGAGRLGAGYNNGGSGSSSRRINFGSGDGSIFTTHFPPHLLRPIQQGAGVEVDTTTTTTMTTTTAANTHSSETDGMHL